MQNGFTSTYLCKECGVKYFSVKPIDMTDESKSHLVIDEDGGARFWGRPIGNDVPLDETGSSDGDNIEPIYNKDQPGDFFEFRVTLTQEQADFMGDTYCYCDAKPAPYTGANGLDFWKDKEQYSNDWTPGFYTDDNPDHYDEEANGLRIPYYRYALFIDGQMVEFNDSISVLVARGDPRGLYMMPYKFRFHSGVNTIRLSMAGAIDQFSIVSTLKH